MTRGRVITRVVFIIVDDEKPKYPSNYVSIIPGSRDNILKQTSCLKDSGEERLNLIQKLLMEAAETNSDPEILAEIRKRQKMIEKIKRPKHS